MEKNKKFGALLMLDDKHFEEMFKEGEKVGAERGLVYRTKTNICEELNSIFDNAKSHGYFTSGFILQDNQIELIFQRHPDQKEHHKKVEIANPDKYKF